MISALGETRTEHKLAPSLIPISVSTSFLTSPAPSPAPILRPCPGRATPSAASLPPRTPPANPSPTSTLRLRSAQAAAWAAARPTLRHHAACGNHRHDVYLTMPRIASLPPSLLVTSPRTPGMHGATSSEMSPSRTHMLRRDRRNSSNLPSMVQ
jgi:hypothetical protein